VPERCGRGWSPTSASSSSACARSCMTSRDVARGRDLGALHRRMAPFSIWASGAASAHRCGTAASARRRKPWTKPSLTRSNA
jgi:hypothetical protein